VKTFESVPLVHSVKSVRGKQWKFCVAAQQDIEKAWSRDELEEKN